MTDTHIMTAIESTLRGPMANAHMTDFGPDARLNEDLHLDSVLILHLLLHLETMHGIDVPEREMSKAGVGTVRDLIAFLTGQSIDTEKEEEIDIKVHCVVSCFSAAIKACPGLDHRPFYFGVWDTGFEVDDAFRLSYHGPSVKHDHFRHWFRRLYGVNVIGWYSKDRTKAENIACFERLLENKRRTEHLMVMLDMYHLPERENKFNQNPFPHYVMIEKTPDPDRWFMHDPDYRWEGVLPRAAILNAINQPTVARRLYIRPGQGTCAAQRRPARLFRGGVPRKTKPHDRRRAPDRARSPRPGGIAQTRRTCRGPARTASACHPQIRL